MPSKLSFVSLSISALLMLSVLSVTTITNALAAISGDTDVITIIDDADYDSSCSPNGVEEHFFIRYQFTGMPTPNSGWYLIYLESSDGVETLIERAWSPGVMEDGSGGGGFGTSLDVGQEPYTLTVYEATGPDPAGPGPFNDETITPKEGGFSASVTFTCADLDPELNPPPEPLTAEIASSTIQGDAPLTVEFQAIVTGGSPPYTYTWDFDGDGNTDEVSDEPNSQHTFNEPGTYLVSLLVIDSAPGQDQTARDTLEITVNEPPPPACEGQTATIVGTAGNDNNIRGTSRSDIITGLGGDDRIAGLGGNDLICGGEGNDRIEGGAGNDRISGESGNDDLLGESGNDDLIGGPDTDTAIGGLNNDRCDAETELSCEA
jgi:PKD repeat protein